MSAPQAPTKLSNKSRNTLMQILALGLVTLALTLQWHQQLGGPIVAQELGHAGIHFTVVSARPNPSTGAVRVLLRPVGQALPAGLHNGAIELYLSAAQLAMVGVTAAQLSAMATVHIARFEVRRFFLNPQLIQWELIPVTGFALRNGALGPFPPPLAAPAPAMSLARAVACWRCSGGVVAVFWRSYVARTCCRVLAVFGRCRGGVLALLCRSHVLSRAGGVLAVSWRCSGHGHRQTRATTPSNHRQHRRKNGAESLRESLRNRCGIAAESLFEAAPG